MKLGEIKPLNESTELLSPEQKKAILDDAQKAVDKFNKDMSKMFPEKEWLVKAKLVKMLGWSITIDFADRDWKVTIHNSDYHLQMMMHLNDALEKGATDFTFDSNMQASRLTNAGVKYRKVKGKSVDDAFKKLLAWFKKNEKLIKESDKPDPKMLIKKLIKRMKADIDTSGKKIKRLNTVTLSAREASTIDMKDGTNVDLAKLDIDKLVALAKLNHVM